MYKKEICQFDYEDNIDKAKIGNWQNMENCDSGDQPRLGEFLAKIGWLTPEKFYQ